MNKIGLRGLMLVFAVSLASYGSRDQNDQINDQIDERTYTNEVVGWEIEIPSGFTVVLSNDLRGWDNRELGNVEKAIAEGRLNLPKSRHLLLLQKDFNSFGAQATSMNVEEQQSYADFKANAKAVMCKSLTNADFQFKVADTETVEIGGLEFSTFQIQVQGPGKVVTTQRVYNRLIDGKDFRVVISYYDQVCGEEMLTAWKNSKFEKD